MYFVDPDLSFPDMSFSAFLDMSFSGFHYFIRLLRRYAGQWVQGTAHGRGVAVVAAGKQLSVLASRFKRYYRRLFHNRLAITSDQQAIMRYTQIFQSRLLTKHGKEANLKSRTMRAVLSASSAAEIRARVIFRAA